jgi:Lon protease-like protein
VSAVIQVPIFPLPDVVLFPHTLLPLHVFEPRYRQLVRDALASDRRIAMALLKPGWERDYYGRPPVYPIAGTGEIIQYEERSDGRFNILLRGTMRIAILAELPPAQPYRLVRARPLPDRYLDKDLKALLERVERLKVFYLRILAELQKGQGDLAKILGGVKDPGIILDRIAGAAIPEAEVRQQVMDAVEVAARYRIVQDHLVAVLGHLSDRNTPTGRAEGRQN